MSGLAIDFEKNIAFWDGKWNAEAPHIRFIRNKCGSEKRAQAVGALKWLASLQLRLFAKLEVENKAEPIPMLHCFMRDKLKVQKDALDSLMKVESIPFSQIPSFLATVPEDVKEDFLHHLGPLERFRATGLKTCSIQYEHPSFPLDTRSVQFASAHINEKGAKALAARCALRQFDCFPETRVLKDFILPPPVVDDYSQNSNFTGLNNYLRRVSVSPFNLQVSFQGNLSAMSENKEIRYKQKASLFWNGTSLSEGCRGTLLLAREEAAAKALEHIRSCVHLVAEILEDDELEDVSFQASHGLTG